MGWLSRMFAVWEMLTRQGGEAGGSEGNNGPYAIFPAY